MLIPCLRRLCRQGWLSTLSTQLEANDVCPSGINVDSEEFKQNSAAMENLIDKLKEAMDGVRKGGSEKAVQTHRKRNKMLPRERIDRLLDPGSPFLELSQLAAHELYGEDYIPSAGIITGPSTKCSLSPTVAKGIGRVHGRLVAVVANDATVKGCEGGTYYPMTVKKHLRLQDIAQQCQLPCIYFVDSGGANLPRQDEVFPDRFHFGRIFYNQGRFQARLSAMGCPQVAVVMGSCTAGGAYVPAMADQTIIVKGNGTIFLGGPALVKAATGEVVTSEELGGAVLHTSSSGVADHLAQNEDHAILLARTIMADIPIHAPTIDQDIEEPLYDPAELNGCIPTDSRKPFDIRSIIARILDGSRFHEFKGEYGQTLVTGFGKLYGQSVGIVANNGVLFSEAAVKGAHFIQLCGQRHIPIIFLQNITGFMIGQAFTQCEAVSIRVTGKKYEARGIAKDGAKMVMAVSNVKVPRVTVIVGGSFGAGNYGMCGRAYDPSFLFMWPNARISVMGGDQAADVLATVHKQNQPGKEWPEEEKEAFKASIKDKYQHEGSAFYSTARLWDDGIIQPKDTRWVLGLALGTTINKPPSSTSHYGVFRM